METSLTEISERLIACKGFRWMPGMRTLGDWRVINIDADGVEVVTDLGEVVLFHSGDLPHIASSLPDLNDPATLGCVLALVREAWGDPEAHLALVREAWGDPEAHLALGASGWVLLSGESRVATIVYPTKPGITEAEALVNALEVAQ